MIEDLFTAIDFKRFILNQRVGITDLNSRYIEDNGLSRTILATNFSTNFSQNNISTKDFDGETLQNFRKFFKTVEEITG